MNSTSTDRRRAFHRRRAAFAAAGIGALIVALAGPLARAAAGRDTFGDFAWMHGVNYVPSYAATDVVSWMRYDAELVDRELGYAESIGVNCVRVFLQSLIYEHDPERFLKNLEDFVAAADRHGLKVMPILFNSCFGVAPSLESRHMWVANPGPDRMGTENYRALDGYVTAIVERYVGDPRIALWDVMNEPTATVLAETDKGRDQIWAFVDHFCNRVRRLDTTHAITVGVATADNTQVSTLVDVLSCHSYAPTPEKLRGDLQMTETQARAAGKPWIVTECCAPGWGSDYEMVMPILREYGVGYCVWELMIGRDQFAAVSGLFYPDGTVRRRAAVEAVAGTRLPQLVAKPDSRGVPIGRPSAAILAEYVRFAARDSVSDATWRERNTLVYALAVRGVYGMETKSALRQYEFAQEAISEDNRAEAYRIVTRLLRQAALVLTAKQTPQSD